MHADHHQALVLVFLGPGPDIGHRAQAIDAGIGPEIDQHDLAARAPRRQRRRVQPFDRAVRAAACALDGQVSGAARRLRRIIMAGLALVIAAAGHHPPAWRRPSSCAGRRRSSGRTAGCGILGRMKLVEQASARAQSCWPAKARQETGIEAQRDRDDGRQHGDAKAAADPFAGAQRALHRGEHPAADQQRQRERRRGAGRVGQQQQRRLRRSRLAAPRRSGSGPGSARRRAPTAGRSRRPSRNDGRTVDPPPASPWRRIATAARRAATSGRVRRSASAGNSSVRPNRASRAIDATSRPYWLACDRPAAADGGQRRDGGEGRGHAEQHRQAAAHERPVGPGEDEGQHRQDARADDRQHAAEIGQDEQDHGEIGASGVAGLKVIATPFMQ